ncbi:MAG: hypothetical protein AAF871_16135 [Pseudomonadota bacterium]
MPINDLHLCVADPDARPGRAKASSAERFLNRLTAVVGEALQVADRGVYRHRGYGPVGFEDGRMAVTSAFAVDDFEAAEAVVNAVTRGTEFEGRFVTHRWRESDRSMGAPEAYQIDQAQFRRGMYSRILR